MENAYASTTSEVLKNFQVTEAQGLSGAQVSANRQKYGRNGMGQFALRHRLYMC